MPRDPFEKLEDAAEVHRLTGIAPSVALHIPWDRVENLDALSAHAAELGLRIGAINPNLFQEPEYKLGSLCNPDAGTRRQGRSTTFVECIDIATQVGSTAISLWLADGTNYPGPGLAAAPPRAAASTRSTRSTARSPRAAAARRVQALRAGLLRDRPGRLGLRPPGLPGARPERANVLVDLGHHAQGVNIEQIVSLLDGVGRLGGFHFNDRKYGDDDLIVGSIDPFQLFRIFYELVGHRRVRERRRVSPSTSRTTSNPRSRQ